MPPTNYGTYHKPIITQRKTPLSAWALVALGFLGLCGLIYGIARFAQSRANRATDTVADLVYTRDALQQTPTIDVDSVFTEKTIRRLNNGDGLTAKFSVPSVAMRNGKRCGRSKSSTLQETPTRPHGESMCATKSKNSNRTSPTSRLTGRGTGPTKSCWTTPMASTTH